MTTFPQPIFQNGIEIGSILAATIESSDRVRPISIDPNVLVEVADSDNINEMSEESFQLLCEAIRRHDFGQPVAVFERGGRWHLIDGVHRRRAAVLCELQRIPAVQYLKLRSGEERVLAISLNKHRGHVRQDIEQRQISELLRDLGWKPDELLTTGYSEVELTALAGLEGASLGSQEDLGALTGTGDGAPTVEDDSDSSTEKKAAILEITFERAEDFKNAKKVLRRYAKAAGVTKGSRLLEVGLRKLIDQAEGE